MVARRLRFLAVAMVALAFGLQTEAQMFKPEMRVPSAEALAQARKMTSGLFEKLEKRKSAEIAEWIVQQVGGSWDASTRVSRTNDFKSKLDIMLIDPPEGVYGKLDGYDLIDESYLPGSNRYFRLTYVAYHQESLMLWEFRFYVKSDGSVGVHHMQWSDTNPFEFLSRGDMLLPRWYDD